MTDLIYDFITTGVDLLFIGAVLASIIVMLRGSNQLTTLISDQQTVADELDYYLLYHAYDNHDGLSAADVLSSLVKNKYELHVCIKLPDGSYIVNNTETGKYYKTSASFVGMNPMSANSSISGSALKYEEVANLLDSTWEFHGDILLFEENKMKTGTFSSNTIVVGLYFYTI